MSPVDVAKRPAATTERNGGEDSAAPVSPAVAPHMPAAPLQCGGGHSRKRALPVDVGDADPDLLLQLLVGEADDDEVGGGGAGPNWVQHLMSVDADGLVPCTCLGTKPVLDTLWARGLAWNGGVVWPVEEPTSLTDRPINHLINQSINQPRIKGRAPPCECSNVDLLTLSTLRLKRQGR